MGDKVVTATALILVLVAIVAFLTQDMAGPRVESSSGMWPAPTAAP